jgi:hypothetical protein
LLSLSSSFIPGAKATGLRKTCAVVKGSRDNREIQPELEKPLFSKTQTLVEKEAPLDNINLISLFFPIVPLNELYCTPHSLDQKNIELSQL